MWCITCDIIGGLCQKDLMEEADLSEIECNAALLDDDVWRSKYASVLAAAEKADPYEWMHESLAKLLPEDIKANKKC